VTDGLMKHGLTIDCILGTDKLVRRGLLIGFQVQRELPKVDLLLIVFQARPNFSGVDY
jgi:hypothetical protein